jgi:hypothetical protein
LVRSLADTLSAAPASDIAAPVTEAAAPATGVAAATAGVAAPAAGAGPLATRDSAADWLHDAGLLPAETGLSGSEHSALLRLRDALREVLAARATGRANPDAAARLTRALADGRLVVTVNDDGSVKLASSARSPYPSVVAAIAVAIAEAAAAGTF